MNKYEIALLITTVLGPIITYLVTRSKNKIDDAVVPPAMDALRAELQKKVDEERQP